MGAGLYWVAILLNATSTQAALLRMGNANFTMFNGEQATAAQRFTSNGTGLTALPSTITPSGNSTTASPLGRRRLAARRRPHGEHRFPAFQAGAG